VTIDPDALLVDFFARSIFRHEPRIVEYVVPKADASISPKGYPFDLQRYDAAYERAWELGVTDAARVEFEARNRATAAARHIVVDARVSGFEIVLSLRSVL
jgi:hypothetical protein